MSLSYSRTKVEPMSQHDQPHRRRQNKRSDSGKSTVTTRNTATASQSTQLERRSHKVAFRSSSTPNDHLATSRVARSQCQNVDSISSNHQNLKSFDGLSTKPTHGSPMSHMRKTLQQIQSSLSQRKTHSRTRSFDGLSTMALCNGSSEYKPPRSRRFDGLSTKVIDGSRLGDIKHGSDSDGLSTKAVDGSRSTNAHAKLTGKLLRQHRILRQKVFDRLSTRAVCCSRSSRCGSYI